MATKDTGQELLLKEMHSSVGKEVAVQYPPQDLGFSELQLYSFKRMNFWFVPGLCFFAVCILYAVLPTTTFVGSQFSIILSGIGLGFSLLFIAFLIFFATANLILQLFLLSRIRPREQFWQSFVVHKDYIGFHKDDIDFRKSMSHGLEYAFDSFDKIELLNIVKNDLEPLSVSVIEFTTSKGHKHRVSISSMDEDERQKLYTHLKMKFPEEKLNIESLNTPKLKKSFTNIWFEYFDASAQAKRNLVEKDSQVLNNRYKIVERIGVGGQGTAYLAEDIKVESAQNSEQAKREDSLKSQSKFVVLKEYTLPLHARRANRMEVARQLHQEIALLSKIQHKQIMKCLDIFVEDYNAYMVLEQKEGKTLRQIVLENGPFAIRDARNLALSLCNILEYIHGLVPPVIHRDFTPDNIVVDKDGLPHLIDFSVAVELSNDDTSHFAGRPGYVPIEQFQYKVNRSTDIYSLGCTLYFLLTGLDPEPLKESRLAKKVDFECTQLDMIISCATKQDSDLRYANVKSMTADLLSLADY